jgi:hypothetical protein
MKHISLFEQFLLEIGDRSAKPYDYKLNGKIGKMSNLNERLYAFFTTESGLEYTLTLINISMALDVDFAVDGEWPETNRGEMFRVMSTLVEIIERVLQDNPEIRGIRYEPKSRAVDDLGKGRDQLYRKFIQMSAERLGKSVQFIQAGGTIFAMFKK